MIIYLIYTINKKDMIEIELIRPVLKYLTVDCVGVYYIEYKTSS